MTRASRSFLRLQTLPLHDKSPKKERFLPFFIAVNHLGTSHLPVSLLPLITKDNSSIYFARVDDVTRSLIGD